jgi:phage tail sheath gpL-like
MALSFEAIPADVKLPLFYAEVTPGAEPAAPNLRMCLIGYANRNGYGPGTGVLDLPYLITRTDATTLFGRGSMLEMMYNRARDQAPWAEIWAIAVSEAEDAIQSVGTINVTHAATNHRNGIAAIYIAGNRVQVRVRPTDTAAEIAANLSSSINQAGTYVKATVSGSEITLTCRWAGGTGNEIKVTYVGPHGRRSANTPEAALTRYLTSIVQMSGGDGDLEPQNTYATLDTYSFQVFVLPGPGGASRMTATQNFMDGIAGRWSPFKQQYGHFFSANIGDVAALQTFGETYEDPHHSVLGIWKSINPPWEWASAVAAVATTHWAAPPELSRPLQTLELRGLYIGSDDDQSFNPEERNLLLNSGISTIHVNDDTTCHIDRIRTLRKHNAYDDPDQAWADAVLMFQAMYFVRSMRTTITTAFPRCALTDRPTGINGFTSPPEIRIVLIQHYKNLEALGLVENSNLFAQFLIVERDLIDRNRVNVLMRPDFVNQLRVVAAIVETHLELDPTDPLLAAAVAA